MVQKDDFCIEIDRVGHIKFYLVNGMNDDAKAIYRARRNLYTNEDRYLADTGMTFHPDEKMEYDIFDSFSTHLVAVNKSKEIICSMRIVPYTEDLGLPMENRYPGTRTFEEDGFHIDHVMDGSVNDLWPDGVPGIDTVDPKFVAEFGRFFRLAGENVDVNGNGSGKRKVSSYDPVSAFMWGNAATITNGKYIYENGLGKYLQETNLAFACAAPKLAKLYSNFAMRQIPTKDGKLVPYKFPLPMHYNEDIGEADVIEEVDFIPLVLSRSDMTRRIYNKDWEGAGPAYPTIDGNLLVHLSPESYSEEERSKAKEMKKMSGEFLDKDEPDVLNGYVDTSIILSATKGLKESNRISV